MFAGCQRFEIKLRDRLHRHHVHHMRHRLFRAVRVVRHVSRDQSRVCGLVGWAVSSFHCGSWDVLRYQALSAGRCAKTWSVNASNHRIRQYCVQRSVAAYVPCAYCIVVDVISLTKADCTHTMTLYDNMVVMFVGLKVALLLLLGLPYLSGWLLRLNGIGIIRRLRTWYVDVRLTRLERELQQQGRRRGSATREIQHRLVALHAEWSTVDWIKIFKSSFMLLFVAYPGVALNVMRMFNCIDVEGHSYLVADMRLECYTPTWAG